MILPTRVVIRGKTDRLRQSASFATSVCLHGFVLAWLVVSAAIQPKEPPKSIYDQEIKPHLDRLIWYNLREKLPDVRPSATAADRRPPRARHLFHQHLVAGAKDSERAPQFIWMPAAPKIELAHALPLPNVLAVAPPRPRRAFTPPAESPRRALPPPLLAEAPKLSTAGEIRPFAMNAAMPRPQARAFTPPPAAKTAPARPALIAEAPHLGMAPEPGAAPALDAPALRPRRAFTAPTAEEKPTPGRVDLAAPPETADSPAPETSSASLAIVGLNPASTTEVPRPPGAHDAGFSAGPEPRNEGGSGARTSDGLLVVPGLLATGGPKDAQPTLAAALTPPRYMHLPGNPPPPRPRDSAGAPDDQAAVRVSSSPDPRWQGRAIYSIAIQMPNVTSYSGSWIVWFAEHEPLPGAPPLSIKPPLPLHLVDPRYIVSAMEERIEGTVRLSAVVRKDGRVDSIALLQHLDARLDRSAEEALSKWLFQPAERGGVPIDVDAVFEIPFRLAPRPKR